MHLPLIFGFVPRSELSCWHVCQWSGQPIWLCAHWAFWSPLSIGDGQTLGSAGDSIVWRWMSVLHYWDWIAEDLERPAPCSRRWPGLGSVFAQFDGSIRHHWPSRTSSWATVWSPWCRPPVVYFISVWQIFQSCLWQQQFICGSPALFSPASFSCRSARVHYVHNWPCWWCWMNFHSFGDDTQMYVHCLLSDADSEVCQLEGCIAVSATGWLPTILNWCWQHWACLNCPGTTLVYFGGCGPPIQLHDDVIKPSKCHQLSVQPQHLWDQCIFFCQKEQPEIHYQLSAQSSCWAV